MFKSYALYKKNSNKNFILDSEKFIIPTTFSEWGITSKNIMKYCQFIRMPNEKIIFEFVAVSVFYIHEYDNYEMISFLITKFTDTPPCVDSKNNKIYLEYLNTLAQLKNSEFYAFKIMMPNNPKLTIINVITKDGLFQIFNLFLEFEANPRLIAIKFLNGESIYVYGEHDESAREEFFEKMNYEILNNNHIIFALLWMNCKNTSTYEYTLPKNHFKFNEKENIIDKFKYKILNVYNKKEFTNIEELLTASLEDDPNFKPNQFRQNSKNLFWKPGYIKES